MQMAGLVAFMASVGLLLARDVKYSVMLLSLEGVLLGTMVWMYGPMTGGNAMIGLATLAVKGIIIPGAMYRVVQEWPRQYWRDRPLPIWAYVAGVALVITVTHIIGVLTPTRIILHPSLFFYGLASVDFALLQMVSRRHVLSQVGALVAAENAFVILAAAVAGHLPMFMEFGMLVDLLMAAVILVWMSHLVHSRFNTADVTAMRFLRR